MKRVIKDLVIVLLFVGMFVGISVLNSCAERPRPVPKPELEQSQITRVTFYPIGDREPVVYEGDYNVLVYSASGVINLTDRKTRKEVYLVGCCRVEEL